MVATLSSCAISVCIDLSAAVSCAINAVSCVVVFCVTSCGCAFGDCSCGVSSSASVCCDCAAVVGSLASFNAASNVLAVAAELVVTVLSPAVAVMVAPVTADALAAEVVVAKTAPISLLAESVLADDTVVPEVACCTLLTKARICAEPATLGSAPLLELDVLDDDLPGFPAAPVLEVVPLLELVPEVELLDEDEADEVDEDDEPAAFD